MNLFKYGFSKGSLIVFLFILITSCQSLVYIPNVYERENRKSTYCGNRYYEIDTLDFLEIELCKEREIARWQTGGKIFIDYHSLKESLDKAVKDYFDEVITVQHKNSFWVRNCEELTWKKLKSKKDETNTFDNQEFRLKISFEIEYMTAKNVDPGANATTAYDRGNDRHDLKYKMIAALFKGDDLLYMDNHTYWDEIFSDRNAAVDYKLPQKIVDSLFALSLKNYSKQVVN